MPANRDDFPAAVIQKLGERVAWLCSNPDCRAPTKGPHTETGRSINVGMACHVHAAASGGPRYDPGQTENERRGIDNGIWLCRTCGTLIDTDEARWPATLLRRWRAQAELAALDDVGKPARDDAPRTVVTSINQHGGQTAGTIINLERPPRRLVGQQIPGDVARRLQLRPIRLSIEAYNADGETLQLARDFFDAGRQLGWDVPSFPGQVICPDPFSGIRVESEAPPADGDDPLLALAEWLRAIGFQTDLVRGADRNHVRVGPRG